jgi:hypothetical protein
MVMPSRSLPSTMTLPIIFSRGIPWETAIKLKKNMNIDSNGFIADSFTIKINIL